MYILDSKSVLLWDIYISVLSMRYIMFDLKNAHEYLYDVIACRFWKILILNNKTIALRKALFCLA